MKKIVLAGILTLATLVSSCSQVSFVSKEPVVLMAKTENRKDYQFVIPANFVLDEANSMIYDSSKYYRAYLIYKGQGNIVDLVDFFDKNMTKLGWQKESSLIGKEAILAYSKEDKLVVIRIEYGLTDTFIRILLTAK